MSEQNQISGSEKVKKSETAKIENTESLYDSETKKNKTKIVCSHCDSSILVPMSGEYSRQDEAIRMPFERQKKELAKSVETMEYESMTEFWLVHDMFTFENIGFTNTVDNRKYLICADCEIGPIGVQCLDKPNDFLLCISRVKHVV